MTRITIAKKTKNNWFRQFFDLKNALNLRFLETVILMVQIIKGKRILIDPFIKHDSRISNQLSSSYFSLKIEFDATYEDLPDAGITTLVDLTKFETFLIDEWRRFKFYVSC